MPANFNADDPNNPLYGLLNGRNRFGDAGRWMPFGAADTMNLTGSQFDPASYTDPRYWEQYSEWDGDNGQRTGWRPRADVRAELGRNEQVADMNIGGPGQIMDPNAVSMNNRFGLLTAPENIRPDPARDRQRMAWMAAITAPAAWAVGSHILGANAAAGSEPLYGGYDPNVAASQVGGAESVFTPGLGEAGAAGAAGVGTQAAVPVTELSTTAAGSAGLTGNAMIDGLLSGAMSNPLRTAGLIQAVSGMFGGGSGGGGGGGGGGQQKGGEGTGVGTGSFQQDPYQPNPITAAQIQNMRFARPRGY